MLERKFIFEENQKIWNSYYIQNLQAWDLENREKLEAQQWTDEEKIEQGKKLTSYNMSLEKITPYKCGYIKKKQSLQQYKPILLQFESYVNKSFNNLTGNDVEEFRNVTEKKNKINCFNAFFVYCVNNGIIYNNNNNKDFLVSLLPVTYRKIGMLLLNKD